VTPYYKNTSGYWYYFVRSPPPQFAHFLGPGRSSKTFINSILRRPRSTGFLAGYPLTRLLQVAAPCSGPSTLGLGPGSAFGLPRLKSRTYSYRSHGPLCVRDAACRDWRRGVAKCPTTDNTTDNTRDIKGVGEREGLYWGYWGIGDRDGI